MTKSRRIGQVGKEDERQTASSRNSSSLYPTFLQQSRDPSNQSISGLGDCILPGLQNGRMSSAYPNGSERGSATMARSVYLLDVYRPITNRA